MLVLVMWPHVGISAHWMPVEILLIVALEEFPADSPNLGILPTRLSLWKEYEARVKATRTWPFNLSMVRTFAFSVLAPIAISLVQRLLSQLFSL